MKCWIEALVLGCILTAPGVGTALAQSSTPISARLYDEARLSRPQYKVIIEANVRVPMRDGVTLSTDILRPDAEGKFPAILIRTPYGKATVQSVTTARWFAERGYAVVQQDVRGRYDSDGQFYAFKNEVRDGYDTDEWIGKQPWFNGKLGTMGGSYVGFTQWAQAIGGSKYLKAMAPWITTPDIYGNWIYIDGALHYGFDFPWGAINIDGHTGQFVTGNNWSEMFLHLPVATSDEAAYHHTEHYRDWLAHPTRDSYWDGISWEKEINKVSVPALSVDGWYDIFLRGALETDRDVRKAGSTPEARNGKRLMIGPWAHTTGSRVALRGGAADPTPIDFGDHAEINMNMVYLRWFDYWLKGVDTGVASEAPMKIFVMGENYWRDEKEWPLARTSYVNYYIHSNGKANSAVGDGTLSTTAPQDNSSDAFTYDPANPVPSMGGNVCCSTVPSGPWDQRPVERRDDVLVYTAPPVSESLEVTGPLTVKLYAATSVNDTDWTAKLVDVHPNGFAQNIQSGIVRARYREGAGKPGKPLQPGKVYEYTIDLWATSHVFLPGHCIRLEISSSDFPRFDRNLNTGDDPNTGTRIELAHQTVYHSAQYASHIVLPVIPRPAILQAHADGPWMGTWQLNLSKSSYSLGSGPAPGTITVFQMKPEKDGFRYTVDTTPPGGKSAHSEAFARFDGKDYPETGNPAADTNGFTRVDDRTYELTDRKNGMDALSFRVTISADAKTRTSVATGKTASGQAVHNVGVWDRQ